jgi:hypothetical protein
LLGFFHAEQLVLLSHAPPGCRSYGESDDILVYRKSILFILTALTKNWSTFVRSIDLTIFEKLLLIPVD